MANPSAVSETANSGVRRHLFLFKLIFVPLTSIAALLQ